MKTALIVVLVFPFLFLSEIAHAQKNYIFFFKPYTAFHETNLYRKTNFKFEFKKQYENIKNADIKSDLDNAIKHSDYRFIAISGYSYLYPGLQNERLLRKYKFKVIEGTSDVMHDNLPPLQLAAQKYAYEYNKRLLLKIKESQGKTNKKPHHIKRPSLE